MDPLLLSLRLAACVSAILLLIGMPLAYWLAYWNWRGKFLLEAIVALPLVLPPTVLGFYVLLALGPHGPIGKNLGSDFSSRTGVHVRRIGIRLGVVQLSVHGAAADCFV